MTTTGVPAAATARPVSGARGARTLPMPAPPIPTRGTGPAELFGDGTLEIEFVCRLGEDAILKAVRATSSTTC